MTVPMMKRNTDFNALDADTFMRYHVPLGMNQLSLFSTLGAEAYTVSQLVARIGAVVACDPDLVDVRVEGEISNFHQAGSGHCYFTLKDAGAELRCVMWRTAASALPFTPGDGQSVTAFGSVGVYEQRGSLQFYVDHLDPVGMGDLYREFELLKARLDAEGLFDPERKRSLPRFPRCIGVVTSPDAAALRDILNVLARRYPLAEVLLAPTLVQGDEAPAQIVAALETLNERDGVDVILVARGGGSLEDLWAFSDERVARAVAASRVPVVCGVGHETDFSLADFAADRRAPTPSAAAEISTPDRAELVAQTTVLAGQLTLALGTLLAQHRGMLAEQVRALRHLSPSTRLAQARQRVDDTAQRSGDALRYALGIQRERVQGLARRLEGLSPLATLERGYAVVHRRTDGRAVRSVAQVTPGDTLDVRISDGEFGVIVKE